MKKLNMRPSKLNGFHKKLADQLVTMHQIESHYDKLPTYDYAQLKKGIICAACNSLKITFGEKNVVCDDCGHQELIDHTVLRSVKELRLLFPDKRITTVVVHEWCRVVQSKKTIRRILMQNYNAIGKKEYSFINLK
jgi:hypothetical protein